MSLIGECYSDVGRRERLARIPAAERTALRLCWEYAANPFLSLPGWSQWRNALSWEQAWLPLSKAGENKQTGCFTWPHTAVSRDGLHATSGGFWRAPTTETVWESVLKSPEQVRNCFSCSPFRSKIKTPSRNKHMLLCIYF